MTTLWSDMCIPVLKSCPNVYKALVSPSSPEYSNREAAISTLSGLTAEYTY